MSGVELFSPHSSTYLDSFTQLKLALEVFFGRDYRPPWTGHLLPLVCLPIIRRIFGGGNVEAEELGV